MRPTRTLQAARTNRNRSRFAEPRWQPLSRYTGATLKAQTRNWLLDDGSLTARLAGSGRGEFTVKRLYQGWEAPLPSERTLLELPNRQIALIREVALHLGPDAVVFARSVFPLATLCGSLAHLRSLQNKSLGAILFSHPGMQRRPFELAPIDGHSPYLPEHLRQDTTAWGRRSRFEIEGKKLLVSEIFLEPFVPWPTTMAVHRTQRGKVSAAIVSPTQ